MRLIDTLRLAQSLALPPGLLVVAGIVAVVACRRLRSVRNTLILATCALYCSSLSGLGSILLHSLEWAYREPHRVHGQVLVMVGEGAAKGMPGLPGSGELSEPSSAELLTVLALHRRTHLPILITGGLGASVNGSEALTARRELLQLGVRSTQILAESTSSTTYENARNTTAILRRHGWTRIVLVVSAFHALRSVDDFRHFGITVDPFPTDYTTSRHVSLNVSDFLPTAGGLLNTATAMNEYLLVLLTHVGIRI